MKKYLALLLALTMIFAFAACGEKDVNTPDGQDADSVIKPVTLIMGHCDPEDEADPYHATCVAFKKHVEELSNGLVTVEIYPNAQLGDERTVIESVQNGSVDCSAVTNAVTSNFQPATKVLDFPFLFDSLEQAREVTGSEAAQKILDSMSDVGIKGLSFTENGFRFILNNKHTLTKPEDLAGLKLRVMQSPVYMSFYEKIKCSAVPLAFGEVYTAVSQKTVDGFDLPMPVILSSKLYEISDYMTDIRYTYTALMVIINQEKFDAYPAEVQRWIQQAAILARDDVFANNDSVLEKGYDLINAAGGTEITSFDDVDFAGFRAISENVWNEQADTELAKEVLAEIVEMTK